MLIKGFASGLRALRVVFVLFAALMLANCGGGGGSSAPPAINGGIGYFDNVSGTGGANVYTDLADTMPVSVTDLQGLLKGNKLMLVSVSQNVAWFGTLTSLNGTAYTADVRIYKDNVPYTTATLKGTLTAGTSISGTLTGHGFGNGSFSLDISTENTTKADVATTLQRNDPNAWKNGNATSFSVFFIDSAGVVTNNSGGAALNNFKYCTINGTVSAVANSAIYAMNITLTGCDPSVTTADGTYTGLLATRSASATNDTLVAALENTTHAYAMYGEFQ